MFCACILGGDRWLVWVVEQTSMEQFPIAVVVLAAAPCG